MAIYAIQYFLCNFHSQRFYSVITCYEKWWNEKHNVHEKQKSTAKNTNCLIQFQCKTKEWIIWIVCVRPYRKCGLKICGAHCTSNDVAGWLHPECAILKLSTSLLLLLNSFCTNMCVLQLIEILFTNFNLYSGCMAITNYNFWICTRIHIIWCRWWSCVHIVSFIVLNWIKNIN